MSEKVFNATLLGIPVSTWASLIALIAFFIYMRSDVDSLRVGQDLARQERVAVLQELKDYKKEVAEQRKADKEETRDLLREIKDAVNELRQDFKKTYYR